MICVVKRGEENSLVMFLGHAVPHSLRVCVSHVSSPMIVNKLEFDCSAKELN
jgi:hypothetical protein